jgi:hypothetical protein
MMNIPILEIGKRCPGCGSGQFSISCLPIAGTPTDFPPGVLGKGDCQTCHRRFLVKLAPELSSAFREILERFEKEIYFQVKRIILETLFP